MREVRCVSLLWNIVEATGMRIWPIRWLAMVKSEWFCSSRKDSVKSTDPEGWKACIAWQEIRAKNLECRSAQDSWRLLSLRFHAPVQMLESSSDSSIHNPSGIFSFSVLVHHLHIVYLFEHIPTTCPVTLVACRSGPMGPHSRSRKSIVPLVQGIVQPTLLLVFSRRFPFSGELTYAT